MRCLFVLDLVILFYLFIFFLGREAHRSANGVSILSKCRFFWTNTPLIWSWLVKNFNKCLSLFSIQDLVVSVATSTD